MVGLVGLLILFGAGVFANFVAPYSFVEIDLNNLLAGADDDGASLLRHRRDRARLLQPRRSSASAPRRRSASSSPSSRRCIGLIVGAIAGYYGGWIDNLLMRFTDLVLTLPALAVLLTARRSSAQGSQWRVSIILALFFWTTIARVVRGVFLSLREKEYVEAAKAAGAGDARIMFRHILPNTLGPIIVNGDARRSRPRSSSRRRSRSSASGSSRRRRRSACSIAERADEPAAVVADRLPGPDDRPDRPLHQLHRRRSARRARPDAAEDPCLSRSSRSATSSSSSRPTTASCTPSTASPTTSIPGETLGIVGESGSGKSVSTMSILGLIPQPPGRSSAARRCSRARIC